MENKNIEKYIAELPRELLLAIKGANIDAFAQEIGRQHNLDNDQIKSLEKEIYMALTGLKEATQLAENLSSFLLFSEDKIKEIVSSIEKEIFEPVMEKLVGVPKSESIQISEDIHPMIEEGEVAHDAPTQSKEPEAPAPKVNLSEIKPEKPEIAPTPKYTYPKGADPYREPVE